MSKFFVSPSNIEGNKIRITGEDVGHIKKVLRMKPADTLVLCDSIYDYHAQIDELGNDLVMAVIHSREEIKTEPPVIITLFQGLPKSDKMELIIQKSVELGVHRIVPVMTERTVVRLEQKKDAESKTSRWQKIAQEAAKQCNRGIIPEVTLPVSFEEGLKISAENDLCLIPYENERTQGLKQLLTEKNAKSMAVFIGPEGGFGDKEIEKAVHSGIKPVSLGPRILRTETAGIAVISILMYELGDMGDL